jgi:phospholipase/carboxylesterase
MNDPATLEIATLERQTGPAPDAAIIWLHGLGADGSDFYGLVPELRLEGHLAARFIFPDAPLMPVTWNGGMVCRSWFDIAGIGPDAPEDAAGIAASTGILRLLVEREMARGIAPGRIVTAGFSQGGAVALHAGLRAAVPLAGVLALSTWLPLAERLAAEITAAGRATPIALYHGSQDPVVPHAVAAASHAALRAAGCTVEWRDYPMPHSLCAAEVEDIRAFLLRVLG